MYTSNILAPTCTCHAIISIFDIFGENILIILASAAIIFPRNRFFFSSPKLISRTTVWRTLNSGIQIDPLNFLPSLQMSKWCFDSSHLKPIQEVVGNAWYLTWRRINTHSDMLWWKGLLVNNIMDTQCEQLWSVNNVGIALNPLKCITKLLQNATLRRSCGPWDYNRAMLGAQSEYEHRCTWFVQPMVMLWGST